MSFTNHTTTFLCMRENVQRRGEGLPTAMDPFNHHKFGLPPVWVDSKEACEVLIERIKTNMERLGEMHASRLVVRMDDHGTAQKDRDIDVLTKETTRAFREAEIKLKEITRADDVARATNSDLNVRLNVQRNLATTLQQLSMQFRRAQKEYMGKIRMQVSAALPSFLKDDTPSTSLLAQDELMLREEQARISMGDSQRIHERDTEVAKIARSIEELGVIFKQLAHLVIEQGSILDRIDQNMDLVVDRTQLGVGELEIAEKYRKSSRATYCVYILTVLIFVFFVILMNKLD